MHAGRFKAIYCDCLEESGFLLVGPAIEEDRFADRQGSSGGGAGGDGKGRFREIGGRHARRETGLLLGRH